MAEEVNAQTDKQMLKHVKCFWCVYSILEAGWSNVRLTDLNLCCVMMPLPIIPYVQSWGQVVSFFLMMETITNGWGRALAWVTSVGLSSPHHKTHTPTHSHTHMRLSYCCTSAIRPLLSFHPCNLSLHYSDLNCQQMAGPTWWVLI